MSTCNKCNKSIKQADIKSCTQCHIVFHYQCLGITAENFAKESKAYKLAWKCSECKPITPTQSKTKAQSNPPNPDIVDELKNYFDKKIEDSLNKLRCDIKRDIKNEIADTKIKIDELTESVNFMSTKYEQLKELVENKTKLIDNLEEQNKNLFSQVYDLSTRLAQIEQQSRECNLEIQCVPENKTENLKSIVRNLATTIGCSMTDQDLLNYHRVAKVNKDSSRPRSIIVKLPSPLMRDEIIAATKIYNRTHQRDKLNSSHLGMVGEKSPVYVSEHLSPSNKQLHAAARKMAKEKKYEFVWVRNGRVYMRKDINSKSFLVKDLDFISTLV